MIASPNRTELAYKRVRRLVGRYGARLWPVALLVLAATFALRERAQLGRIGGILKDADPSWVMGAVAIQLAMLWLTALIYRSLLGRLGHRVTCPALVRMHLRRVVVGTVTPVGGPPSLYVLVHYLRRWGVPADDALLVAALRSAVGYAAFLLMLVPAVLLHGASGRIAFAAGLATTVFVGCACGLRMLLGGPRLGGRLPRWVPGRLRSFVARAGGHGVRSGDLIRPFGFAVVIRLSGAAMLYASLRALGSEPAFSVPLAAYALGLLVLSMAPFFQGIGVVEVATAVALERLGVPGMTAIGAALLCRLGELWLPLSLGLALQVPLIDRSAARLTRALRHAARRPRSMPRRAGSGVVPSGIRAWIAD